VNHDHYPYQPTVDDVQKFEEIWTVLWHPRFRQLDLTEYYYWKNLFFEVFLCGMNQHKYDVRLEFGKLLEKTKDDVL